MQRPAQRHHYVPQFLMQPWAVEDSNGQIKLRAKWLAKKIGIRTKINGVKAFCYRRDLWTINSNKHAPDFVETNAFQEIDRRGAAARNFLLAGHDLSKAAWNDFFQLLQSLEVRRPQTVTRIRNDYADKIRIGLDDDPKIKSAAAKAGLKMKPSKFFEKQSGINLFDLGALFLKNLTDSDYVKKYLDGSLSCIIKFERTDGSLILSDRPLIRHGSLEARNYIWALPLDPHTAFILAPKAAILNEICQMPRHQLLRIMNVSSAIQAEKYVFCIDDANDFWLPKYLAPSSF